MSTGLILVSLVLTHFGVYTWGVVRGARIVDNAWQAWVLRVTKEHYKLKVSDLYPEKKND